VVAVLTGHVLKDPGILLDMHQQGRDPGANAPVEIDPTVAAVAAVLAGAA
jgi:threonine synthase